MWRKFLSFLLLAAKEARAHDLAGDNEKDFDPFKDVERAAQKAAALAGANLKDVQSKVSHLCVYSQLVLVHCCPCKDCAQAEVLSLSALAELLCQQLTMSSHTAIEFCNS